MQIVAIAVVADSGVIGSGEDMLWYISADFRRFKTVTTGNTITFGRRAHEQIGLLPNRHTIVVIRQPDWSAEGVEMARPIEEAIRLAHTTPRKTYFIGGGGEIYVAAWPYLTELDITHVHQEPEEAVIFLVVVSREWTEISCEIHRSYDFVQYRPTPALE